jgi:Kdo2-lipid IVA lauroyltransferase/acyltransferase
MPQNSPIDVPQRPAHHPRHQKFLRAIARNGLIGVRAIVRRLPYGVFRLLKPALIAIGRPLLKKKKRILMQNLRLAFGSEKTDEEIGFIADRCLDNFGAGMIELIYFLDRPQRVIDKVSIVGQEHLEEVLKQGKGAVLLSAHFGNFILMFLRMALAGYKTNVIMRRMKDKHFENYISAFRNENGMRTIYAQPRQECVEKSLKVLRDNQLLFILLDQNYGEEGGVYVDFFGRPAATATGPVIFSARARAPILPVFIVRDGADRYKIRIDPPVKFTEAQDSASRLVAQTAQLTKIIEDVIRRYPQEWGGWMHRRWKNQEADRTR